MFLQMDIKSDIFIKVRETCNNYKTSSASLPIVNTV